MLSVQVPGCAGMERLGAPGGPRLRHDHRHHHSTLEWEKQQRLQAMVGRLQEMVEQETRARSAAAAERLGLPPSIQLPDGEYGQDAHLQIRVPYQVPSRADEKQLSAATEQVRERRARVGGRGGRAAQPGRRGRRQERRSTAEGHALVGAHGRAAAARLPTGRAAALRDGTAPRRALAAARRVTSPLLRTSLSYHAYIPLSGRSDSPECTRVPEYYRLGNLFIWDSRANADARACFVICATGSCCDSVDRADRVE
ncbi:uncharacterized protein LOC120630277 isoform X2 [Pararge aegeria]|nr:uncharacterized protein LOC120630277 isoform X2 [Pararge aegeria]